MQPDFAIIGAGVIGLTTALELSRQGARVIILERGEIGRECSWAGAGILAPLAPWDEPEAAVRLALYSSALFPAWSRELATQTDIDPEHQCCGLTILDPKEIEYKLASYEACGMPCKMLDAGQILPELGANLSALWLPEVTQIRPPRLLAALRKRLENLGVEIHERTEVVGWKTNADQIVSVETQNETLTAGNFIVCAGAWSSALLGKIAFGLKIMPIRGQILLFKTEPGLLKTIVVKDKIYCVPRHDGHILVGTTLENVGFDKHITQEAKHTLLRATLEMLPGVTENHLVKQWAGLRPGSAQNAPTISRHPEFSNLYVNAGHYRYGVTMAPGSARLMSSIALGFPHDIDPKPYRWPT